MPTEAGVVAHHGVHAGAAGDIGNIVQVAVGVGVFVVDGRRNNFVGSMARAEAMASIAPAPPSKCPVMLLVDDTSRPFLARSPNSVLKASVSFTSLSGVDVPCALTYPMASGDKVRVGKGGAGGTNHALMARRDPVKW